MKMIPGLAALALASVPVAAGAARADQSFGTWRNPQNSVHVRAEPCGQRMCGVVVWANDKARADAARGGTDKLVGATLFKDFRLQKPGLWRGKVFVPDIGKTFSGTIEVVDETHLKGSGCLVGRIGCKSQSWTRIAQ
ncbi:hypothetical protein HY78_23890 [Rhizorhabdus wittichii DC-6]|jgi:uncharacterized protein (DUF2147 family)|nr:hypothetical protein HY78_23890 [Rhizorhabdus wittichii DC-6]